jgi:hypothetical protein
MLKNCKAEGHTLARQWIAVLLSFILVPATQLDLYAQESYVPLGAEQLNQLVAPIALYPDSLVAQVLTASTYPDQVMDAQSWSLQNGGLRPEDRAAAADRMQWDPSVKALTAFPSVLENLARNNSWTRELGNAYYNQPGDVMNAIQAMRMRARGAGVLRTTAQYRVIYDNGPIVIEPFNPAYVYVPYYNPWVVYGAPLPMYRGWYALGPPPGVVIGLGIGFGLAIGIGLWAHYGWGWHAWGSNWRGGGVMYNRNVYISNSRTVVNYGHFGGYNRGVYEHAGQGVPAGFHPPMTGRSASYRPAPGGYNRPGNSGSYRSTPGGNIRPGNAGVNRPGPSGTYRPGNSGTYRPGGNVAGPVGNNRPGNASTYRPGGNSPGPSGAYRPGNSGANHPGNTLGHSGNPSGPATYHPQGGANRAAPVQHAQQPQVTRQPQGNVQSHPQGGGQSHPGGNPKGHK